MSEIKLRDLTIGSGRTKICVPLTGRTQNILTEQAKKLNQSAADMAEWRADYFEFCLDTEKTLNSLKGIRDLIPEKPILFTFRTLNEGGETDISPEDYARLCEKIISTGIADAVDIELNLGEEIVRKIILAAKKNKMAALVSYHDFNSTPEKRKILSILQKMQALGADIAKAAVMPESLSDVLSLLAATDEFRQKSSCPVITMAMGELGKISRISGGISGSAVSFASMQEASAPGQLSVSDLSKILDILEG